MLQDYPDARTQRSTVLVAVLNNEEDLRRAASDGWYRIPQRRAPKRIGADYLAFYQTGAFRPQPEAQTITFYASIRRYRLLTRAELLPEAVDHPRAEDYYFRLDIGPLQRLEHAIPSATMRRVTFISTTMQQMLTAGDIRELYSEDDPYERLWNALRAGGLRPLNNRLAGEIPVDITLRARGGYLGVVCRDVNLAEEGRIVPAPWTLLSLSSYQIETDLDGCLRKIGAALIDLGGSV